MEGKTDKTSGHLIASVVNQRVHGFQERMATNGQALKNGLKTVFFDWGILIAVIGFLLGRAMILAELTPFILPFLAAVFILRRAHALIATISLLAGAILSYHGEVLYTIVGIISFLLIYRLAKIYMSQPAKSLPYIVFIASLLTRLGIVFLMEGTFSQYALMMATVEAGLSFILTMIFIQSIPLITGKRGGQSLRNEEIICLIILLASVMTGTVGWAFQDVVLQHSLARYLVLVFAFVGGAAIGSTVGVVTGLILSLASVASLYQMSLLAFSGLLGGLLKEGNRIGVSFGLLVGTLLIAMYGDGGTSLAAALTETGIAIGLFMMTPRSWLTNVAKYIPGTVEHSQEQQQYLRKVRDATAGRVERFSSLFQTLSNSFKIQQKNDEDQYVHEVDVLLSHVTEKTCQTCLMKEKCWVQNFNQTYDSMTSMVKEIEIHGTVIDPKKQRQWRSHCRKPDQVIAAMSAETSQYRANKELKRQVQESQRLVADQLLGVSRVMGDFAKEIQKEKQPHMLQEEHMIDALRGAGMDVGHIDIYSMQSGRIEIEMSILCDSKNGEAEKIIAPMLSDLVKETIVLKREETGFYSNGYSHISFGSARPFVIESGVAKVAKGGEWLSGDNYAMIELNSDKYAVAISDGMGNGEKAYLESSETLALLQKVLQSGIEETVAIKSVNSILSLRNTDEMFSTLDLAMIDMQDAHAKFLKIGSTPSFIKRGSKVTKIEAGNLPMGILPEFEVEVVSEQLKDGDLLIMCSDGIFDAKRQIENQEQWMKRIIAEIETNHAQEVADVILERVIRSDHGNIIEDDMTVVVTRIKRNRPKWTSIPIHPKAQKPKKSIPFFKQATGT
ncbi:stage II sporulation protein E [Alkalihalobacillus xiaoxiensis]|uniref:Stage II sporulation protein E n=1 Tax=Shouchella xiaoxiensis TaxID=766895 RepID=A0ABS2T0M6_9BACI|nr:stage II sporulation protein E [Shouchella xiaoxiensis]MBM7841324.1 stage II sporulation protein E [Shouchella xiaoxiensis]